MKETYSSRALNESSGMMGLTMWDVCGVGYVFVLSHTILEKSGLGLLSFGIGAASFYALSIVRSLYRPKIIRDSVKHLFCERKIYDPATRKNR